jgi:hypothetical protein
MALQSHALEMAIFDPEVLAFCWSLDHDGTYFLNVKQLANVGVSCIDENNEGAR